MDYTNMSKAEVLAIAEPLGIPGASKLTRDELIESMSKMTSAKEIIPAGDPKLADILATLGMRTVYFTVEEQVQVGVDDLRRPVVDVREVQHEREELSADLNEEEVVLLEEAFGKQEWVWSDSKERFCCVVTDGVHKRRFMSREVQKDM